jgi:hypothetical protein
MPTFPRGVGFALLRSVHFAGRLWADAITWVLILRFRLSAVLAAAAIGTERAGMHLIGRGWCFGRWMLRLTSLIVTVAVRVRPDRDGPMREDGSFTPQGSGATRHPMPGAVTCPISTRRRRSGLSSPWRRRML